jgi:hypothetical protein
MGMSPDQQIEKLRRAERLSWIPRGLFALTLVLIALGFMSGHELFFVVGVFAGLAAIAARRAAPHWRNAITAIHNGRRSKGNVSIAITRDPTEFDRYVATVRDESQHAWQFEFTPNYWQPTEGDFKAEIYYVRSVEWPALLLTPEDVLFPAFKPKKITANA